MPFGNRGNFIHGGKVTDDENGANNPFALGTRDAAGGGIVGAYSAATRKATPLSKEEQQASIKQGVSPDTSKGSQTAYQVRNNAMSGYGETMGQVKSDYKTSRKQGFTPDQARGIAVGYGQGDTKMVTDAYGEEVR
jgi:hypothetical protein